MAFAKDRKPLNIDKFLERIITLGYKPKVGARNRIYRVGVELEGGWRDLPSGCDLVHDGSVKIKAPMDPAIMNRIAVVQRSMERATTNNELYALRREYETLTMNQGRALLTGELPSEPMELSKVPIWMKKFYPQHVNETCGLHVHMSFQSAYHYSKLMIPEYPITIVKYLGEWAAKERLDPNHPIWSRLSGESTYCQPVFDPDRQARKVKKEYDHHAPGNRYSMVSYQWSRLGTIECRILPMMDTPERGIAAVQRVIDITNACLAALKQKDEKLKSEVIADPTEVVREERVAHI